MAIPVAYIIGPFRAPHHWGVVQNVRAAEAVALQVWLAGAAALCPHLNCVNFEGAAGDSKENASIWLDGDIAMLKRCDAVVLVPGWEKSTGSRAEVEIARAEGLAVFFSWDQPEEGVADFAAFKAWVAAQRGEMGSTVP